MRDAVDACLTRAFRDVAVPEGLAERLLAGLAVDGGADIPVGGADIPVCRKGHSAFGRQECLPHRSRRWLFLAGGVAAAAATILLAVWLGGQGSTSISQQTALDAAIQSFDAGFKQPGISLAKQSAPPAYPFSPQVVTLRGTSWHWENFLGRRSVVYDLPGNAALFVVACNGVQGVGTAPDAPQHAFTTAACDCCASAWQEGGLLYVLVVRGDASAYGRYLNLPHSPVA